MKHKSTLINCVISLMLLTNIAKTEAAESFWPTFEEEQIAQLSATNQTQQEIINAQFQQISELQAGRMHLQRNLQEMTIVASKLAEDFLKANGEFYPSSIELTARVKQLIASKKQLASLYLETKFLVNRLSK